MAEILKDIDPKILELWTSPKPDFDLLRRKATETAVLDWKRVYPQAIAFIRDYGNPRTSANLWAERINSPDSDSPEQTEDSLRQGMTRFSVREAWFPLEVAEGRTIQLTLIQADPTPDYRELEQVPGTSDLFSDFEGVYSRLQAISQNRLLFIGSSEWRDQRDRFLRFLVPSLNAKIVNPLMVSCVEAMSTLGRQVLDKYHHIPSPS